MTRKGSGGAGAGSKAVVLGTNYYIGLSAIRCLGRRGVHTVAVDYSKDGAYGAASKYTGEHLIAPHYKEERDKFVQFLKSYARKQSAPPVLVPCHDAYVEIMDDYFDALKEHFLFPQTEAGVASRLMNKETLAQVAREHGVLVPETVGTGDESFMEKVLDEIGFPCIVKPIDSPSFVAVFRRKLFQVGSEGELKEALAAADEAGLEVIVQRIIPGFDDHMYTYDAYLDQSGKVAHWHTFQKYRQYPINFGASVYTVHKPVPELHAIGSKFLEGVNYKGFAEIEFKKDAETGRFYLIEVNVRLTNFNNMLYKLGMNVPYMTYRELTEGRSPEPFAGTGARNMAFWYAYEDLLAVRDYVRTGQLGLGRVFRTFFKPKAYAIWDWGDMRPGFAWAGMMARRVTGRFSRRHRAPERAEAGAASRAGGRG